ncbi:hypothetical protein I0C86_40450 [Plantactinospora sp. S1510]|uniref:Uncharacterized protein n=1 Tax=Plantactinospora alkalitolerans TaxID=2789879 RepID=A0ABS0H9I9_9ACTN|nr:hypothetical protein [Plantactinospora alkalitolerans]MBF9135152.1 hypothetical protein [Plantactinospora alkalitolerans]
MRWTLIGMKCPPPPGRTDHPAWAILMVASVVADGRRLPLTGWMRREAMAAMTALGYSATHVAWALRMSVSGAKSAARQMGIKLHPQDQRPDVLSIWMLCKDPKLQLPITTSDRPMAVRALALRRRTAAQIAYQIRIDDSDTVTTIAGRAGVEVLHPQGAQADLIAFARRNPDSQLANLVAA